MRVLFYAANPDGEDTLRLEHEITELQRASFNSTRRIDFVFLPALPFEDIGEQINIYQPDVVHISAHGADEKLVLADAGETKVLLTAEALKTLLAIRPPKLLYLNACCSLPLAEAIIEMVPFAIGTTAPVTNFAARKGAVNFYRGIIRGWSLDAAHESSSSTINVLSNYSVKSELKAKTGLDVARHFLYEPTRLVAFFEDHNFIAANGSFTLRLGIAGCPPGTHQVVFCADDPSFIRDNGGDLESCLCSVERSLPSKGEIWLDHTWEEINGDFKIYALGIPTGTDPPFAVSCMVCDALEEFYRVYFHPADVGNFPPALTEALARLRENDGSMMRPQKRIKALLPSRRPKGQPV
jgi:hypothetical protein